MKPLTRILAATDLSAPARHAVDRAFRLAAESGARLEISHVISRSASVTKHILSETACDVLVVNAHAVQA